MHGAYDATPMPPTPPQRWPLLCGAVLTLAAAVRLASPAAHFAAGRLVPADADSAYHLRRAASFFSPPYGIPSVQDPFLGFPEGAPVPWAPGWDAWLALWMALGRPFGLGEFTVALAPLVAGVGAVALLLSAARERGGAWVALLAGLLLAGTPQHVAATQFARLDHNAVEGFALLWLTVAALRPKVRPWEVAGGLAMACLGWVGGLLYAGLGMAALGLRAVLDGDWAPVRGMLLGSALVFPIATAMGIAQGTPFTYAQMSAFHPTALLAGAAAVAWAVALRTLPERRRLLLGGGGIALVVGSVALGPFVWTGLREWLLTGDPWLASIPEMQPLFSHSQEPWVQPARMLGWGLYAFPFAWGFLAVKAGREHLGLLLVSLGAGVLACIQNRFGWSFAPLLAWVLAASLGRAVKPSLHRFLPLASLSLLLFSPNALSFFYLRPKARQYQVPWSFEAYHFLARGTPPVDPQAPEYGVLGLWDHGHWITVIGQKPAAIGHFGSYAGGVERWQATQDMYAGGVPELLALMDGGPYRYLLVESHELPPGHPLLQAGSSAEGAGHVDGLRLVFAAQAQDLRAPGLPGAWVYERVPGAVLQGHGQPGQKVGYLQELAWGEERWPWRAFTQVHPDGTWSLRVPYATGSIGEVTTAPTAALQVGGQVFAVQVPEQAVRTGAVVQAGP